MKKINIKSEYCVNCQQCENVCSNLWFKEINKEKSCIRILNENDGIKITVCSQCGECIDICPVQAIYRDANGVVRINKKDCVGCFMCVGFCPEGAMFMHPDYIEPFKCVACGQCVKVCPTGTIEIIDKKG
ncbi:hypothetical protein Q428_11175, partial [Fervidicella metallireducens AeB]